MSSILSAHERSVIETMIKLNHSIREIVRFLKRSPATITYELNRIKPYNAQQAHHLARRNQHKHGRHSSLTPEISAFLNHHRTIEPTTYCVRHISGRNSQAVTPAIIRFFKGIKNAKSITVNHGREFAKYDEIEGKLGIPMYFAHPYSPEERGSNEVLNRYVRRFIPKERKIETISQKELDQINHWVNARPMKTLNWQSPRKVFQQHVVFG